MKEKLARSYWSKSLELHEWLDSATTIAAAGASQIHHRQRHVGFLLHRIKAGQTKYIPEALHKFSLIVKRESRRLKWKGMTNGVVATLSEIALEAFLSPNCPTCTGIGQIGGYDQRIVAICQTCRGTGKRQIDSPAERWKLSKRFDMRPGQYINLDLAERIKDAIGILERLQGHSSDATRKQVRTAS